MLDIGTCNCTGQGFSVPLVLMYFVKSLFCPIQASHCKDEQSPRIHFAPELSVFLLVDRTQWQRPISYRMFAKGHCQNLTDLIVSCCPSLVNFRIYATEVLMIFLLATISTTFSKHKHSACLWHTVLICGRHSSSSLSESMSLYIILFQLLLLHLDMQSVQERDTCKVWSVICAPWTFVAPT